MIVTNKILDLARQKRQKELNKLMIAEGIDNWKCFKDQVEQELCILRIIYDFAETLIEFHEDYLCNR